MESLELKQPRLVAVWPGMGHVALNAGIYVLSKLSMTLVGEFAVHELFDVEYVDVKAGVLNLGRRPRNRLFLWSDPEQKHDLLLFLGEAQPAWGKYAFCRQLVELAKQHEVERIYTFAAMATEMLPDHASRVFVAASDQESLAECLRAGVHTLEDGHVSGLNGILLGVAKEQGLSGACLLGEMPHVLSQLPFPQASLEILRAFLAITGLSIDLAELATQAETVSNELTELVRSAQQAAQEGFSGEEAEEFRPEPSPEEGLDVNDRKRIERYFQEASRNRSKAFELKQELDRLGVFKEYEDRFLDLFKKAE